MKKLKAVVFDLDDTLYPEREFVLSGLHVVTKWAEKSLGIKYDDGFIMLKSLFETGIRGDIFNQWLEHYDLMDKVLVKEMVHIYRKHFPQIKPFSEVTDLLSRLKNDYKLGLLSDGYLEVQQNKLYALGLATFFDSIVFSDEIGIKYWKPHKRPFFEILKKLEVEPEHSVYIADNPTKDFCGARKAGMKSIRFRHPEGEYSTLEPISEEYAPDYEIIELKELFSFLNTDSTC